MRADSPPPDDPGDPSREAVERAAAIDDFFGGFAQRLPADAAALTHDESPLPGSLDLLLLLRQTGASGVAPPPAMPDSVGRYRILRLAGRGGFSVVWEAFDPVLRRRVAVKVCSPDALLSPAIRSRFRREAELASRLTHPHIVTIHEVGDDDGLEFITTEFCAGGSLAEWLARHPGPIQPQTAARIARAVAQAAAHAHNAGVIHRDIKPGNVLLAPVDGRDETACVIPMEPGAEGSPFGPAMTVKLSDFGLGRQSDPGDGEDPLTQLTSEGSRLGTPAWMAPEQIDRSFGAVGPATDVHAIGLLLDRMLTGRPLRGGKTDIETYREVLLDDPVAADRVVRGVPADLAAVCMKCLSRQPHARYPSAAALADDLGRWLAGLPTHARPLTPLQRIGRSVARRPVAAGLAIAAALSLCLAGWAALERSRAARQAVAHQSELRRQNAAAELRRGFESLRAANVAGAIEQLEKTRAIDPELADSLAAKWLERRLHGEREILLRPASPPDVRPKRCDLHCMAVSTDGETIVAGGADGRLRVLRTNVGPKSVMEIPAHDEINDVCLSSDGRLIASVGQDGRLRWCTVDAPDRVAGEAPPAGCPLYGVAFSADGSAIFYGGEDCVLRRIDVNGATPPRDVTTFPQTAEASPEIEAIASAGSRIVVACGGGLAAFDETDGHASWTWNRGPDDTRQPVFHALAASPDGRLIAAGGSDRGVGIWDAASGTVLSTLPPHPNWVQACRFSADGAVVATACRDGVVRTFDASTGTLLSKLVGHADRVWDVAFAQDGSPLSLGADGTLRRWDASRGTPTSPLREVLTTGPGIPAVRDATFGDAPCQLAAVRVAAPPVLIDVATGHTRDIPYGDRLPNDGMAIDLVRGRLAFGFNGENRGIAPLVVELDGLRPTLQTAPLPNRAATVGPYLCWTPTGHLVTNATDGRVYAWSPTLDRVREVGAHATGSHRVEAAPAGPSRVVVAGKPGVILHLEDDTSMASPLRLEDRGDHVSAVAWSPDGTRLVCGFRNGSVHCFDGTTGRQIGGLPPHERQVVDVAWSSDGRAVLTADAECVRLSDAATLTALDDLRPGWLIDSMCLAANDSYVVIAGHATAPESDVHGRLAVVDLAPR